MKNNVKRTTIVWELIQIRISRTFFSFLHFTIASPRTNFSNKHSNLSADSFLKLNHSTIAQNSKILKKGYKKYVPDFHTIQPPVWPRISLEQRKPVGFGIERELINSRPMLVPFAGSYVGPIVALTHRHGLFPRCTSVSGETTIYIMLCIMRQ